MSVTKNEGILQLYCEFLANLPDAAILADVKTLQILSANPAACKLYGYLQSELINQPVFILTAEPERTRRRLAEVGEPNFERLTTILHRRKDGTTFLAEIHTSVFELGGQQVFLGLFRDRTVQEIIEQQLQKLNERLSITLRALPDLIIEFDYEGRYVDYYASRPDLLYLPFEEQLGRTVEEVLPAEAAAVMRSALHEAAHTGASHGHRYMLPHQDSYKIYEVSLTRKPAPADSPTSFIAIIRDITERAEIEQRLAKSEANYRQIVEFSSDLIFTTDADGQLLFVNPSGREFIGLGMGELSAHNYLEFVAPEWREAVRGFFESQANNRIIETKHEYKLLGRSGEHWVEQSTILLLHGDQPAGFQGIIRDISERKALEQALTAAAQVAATEAQTDPLTGLHNRRAIMEKGRHELKSAQAAHQPYSLGIADLDSLKAVNDTYGHTTGDAYIQLLAETLNANLRSTDAIGRIGGDEFILLFPNTSSANGEKTMRKLLAAIGRARLGLPDGKSISLQASLGLATATSDDSQLDLFELIENADKALYKAKRQGKNTFVCYTPEDFSD